MMFKVELEKGTVIEWDDGEYRCEDQKVLDKLRACGKKIAKMRAGVYLNEVCLASGADVDYEKNRFTAYALIRTVAHIKNESGDIPSLEELYGKSKDGEVN